MNKYRIVQTGKFKKDLKTAIKRGYNIALLQIVIDILASGQELPAKYKDHRLIGKYKGWRECHITPDWLLMCEIDGDEGCRYRTRTGTHSGLLC